MKRNKITLILKAVLLWVTALHFFLFIVGIESLMEAQKWAIIFIWTILNMALFVTCYSTLSYQDIYKLSGAKKIDKILLK